MNKQALKIGVIGAGYRFSIAARVEQSDHLAQIVAVVDPAQGIAEKVHQQLGRDLPIYSDTAALYANHCLDAVMILSPDYMHESHALEAIANRVAIFLEKPMATSTAACDHILNAANTAGVKIYLGHNMRHMAFSRTFRELIEQKAIGEIKTIWCRHFIGIGGDAYFRDWHAEQRYSNSLLIQKGSHDLDVLCWLSGSVPKYVTAMGKLAVYDQVEDIGDGDPTKLTPYYEAESWPPLNLKSRNPIVDVEDLSMMLMEMQNGIQISYQQCHFSPDTWRNYTIIGTEGRMENFGDRGDCGARIDIWRHRGGYMAEPDERVMIEPDNRQADQLMVQEFLDFLSNERSVCTDPVTARYAVAAGEMAAKSIRNGSQPQLIPPIVV